MNFRKPPPKPTVPDSPEKILLDLPRRKIPGVLLHQGEVMRRYAKDAVGLPDVALQLPTGSGKTLVGLLIAEWRRRKYGERVVYLCPTRQLVNQVAEQANDQYGLRVDAFVGSITGYDANAKAAYQSAERIAVTTYSSLFNTNPYFKNAHLLLIDDAHAADNYISETWSLRVRRDEEEHEALHTALASLLRPLIGEVNFARLSGDWSGINDATWVDKVASPKFFAIANELGAIIDVHSQGTDLKYPWSMVREHLHACHLYVSSNEILLRPLIAPTWTHGPFVQPKQRIYISATLGEGGDLERLTGRRSIFRLPVPTDWDRQGIGRRFFMFPGMSLSDEASASLRLKLMQTSGRSVVLVPSDADRSEIADDVKKSLGFETFSATDIEKSKKAFVSTANAVAVVANRYDGIDFPGDDCRLLFVEGLPSATNIQERFLMACMGARILFNNRIQTRVVQAIGRCTRALQDSSAVVISGSELSDYLADKDRRAHLDPELQAEIEFGIDQSRDMKESAFVKLLELFLENGDEWEGANEQIIALRDEAKKLPFPSRDVLANTVSSEIEYQTALWQGDFEAALGHAEHVIGLLTSEDLRGYRALWHYLAGSAATLASKDTPNLEKKAKSHFGEAKKAAPGIFWLVGLTKEKKLVSAGKAEPNRYEQIERLERYLEQLGSTHDHKFAKREKDILQKLSLPETFEQGHKLLGEFLGYDAGKVETEGAPDPWWISDGVCLVFEDHAGHETSDSLSTKKARQVALHPNWMRENTKLDGDTKILSILVTPLVDASEGAKPHLKDFSVWPLDAFRAWATQSVATVRELRKTFVEVGDLDWRARAIAALEKHNIDATSLHSMLTSMSARDYFLKD